MSHYSRAALVAAASLPALSAGAMLSAPRAEAAEAAAVRDLMNAFEAFREKNDRRLAEIEARGSSDVITEAEVERINAAIDQAKADIDRIAQESAQAAVTAHVQNDDRDWQQDTVRFLSAQHGRPVHDVTPDQVTAYREYGQAVTAMIRRGGSNGDQLSGDLRAAMSIGQDSDGGWLVPIQVAEAVQMRQRETSDMRAIAGVMSIGTDRYTIPLDIEEAASGGWVGEKQTRSDTNTPGLGDQTIDLFEQYAQPKATQKLLDDAEVNVEAWLAGKIADILSRTENTAFVTGNGVNKPTGFLGYAGAAVAASSSEHAWGKLEYIATGVDGAFAAPNASTSTLPADKLIDLIQQMKTIYRANGRFAMNRATAGSVRKLKDVDGNYLWQPSIVAGQPDQLLGYPVAELEDMPDIASDTFSIAFGDFRAGYQILDRQGIRVLRDPYTDKPYVKFYTTKRVGGDVVDFDAIKLLKFGTS
ncbi:phage major capsid protein [Maricaulis sp.]|uniref:phage major capsid protein n=1 Tax=Maricaulis sp. TaxID=1486257 RepID=UPI000C5AF69F|nr:phage major capsid protein [Maricaulis sp.]MAC89664.1 phage major capsid protein [Maricaulis sp.]